MANVIKKATNKFTKGLVMDFSPENTKNEVLTNALNATLLTFNGNELSLQNDMGNARVESAFLPEGYIPVGTCEYGGIIYIVSYNPLEDKSQIGCFPSPERNVSREEMGRVDEVSIIHTDFQVTDNNNNITGDLKNVTHKILLKDGDLNPGDKFVVSANPDIYNERLQDLFIMNNNEFIQVDNPMVSLNLVSIQDNGKIVYLNSDVRKYETTYTQNSEEGEKTNQFKYHIIGQNIDQNATKKIDLDDYRSVLSSGYNVFKEKTSGKLAILAELITIDQFSLTHSVEQIGEEMEGDVDYYKFEVKLHPEVSPEITQDNYNYCPKLKYYQIKDVKGQLQAMVGNEFKSINYQTLSNLFENTYLTNKEELYHGKSCFIFSTNDSQLEDKLKTVKMKTLNWDFSYSGFISNMFTTKNIDDCYYKVEKDKYYVFNKSQLLNNSHGFKGLMYALDLDEGTGQYSLGTQISIQQLSNFDWVALKASESQLCKNNSLLNSQYNYIQGFPYSKKIEEESAFETYEPDYIPNNDNRCYEDFKIASFRLPKLLVDKGISLPFKYDYTIVPCMEYGKLDFLSISNTIDLNNLYNFNASSFNTWKYRIDGDQLMLTVGAEIFDTFEQNKVDGLFFEFYDWRGFVGSMEITGKKSYSGKFTKVISLNQLDALSKNRLLYDTTNNEYRLSNQFVRNADILKNNDKFYYNNSEVVYLNDEVGWCFVEKKTGGNYIYDSSNKKYVKTDNGTHDLQPLVNNDCGILYSNLIYGVKPYLRKEVNGKKYYIKKDDLFLFTIPIYNDYYYNLDNFNQLVNPKLSLVLTYKLQDFSSVDPFSFQSGINIIKDGYLSSDYDDVENYKQGKSTEDKLEFTKYLRYQGVTKLNLEIGLNKDYENWGLSCDKDINQHFTCNLRLCDNDGELGFSTLLDDQPHTITQIDDIISKNSVYLKFDTGQQYPIENDFQNYNFITSSGSDTIDINYSFVVGNQISIDNIRTQVVPTTTVCALFHKQANGLYNYEDFNIYKYTKEDGSEIYVSDLIFYNSGDANNQIFGTCKMVDPLSKVMYDQCISTQQYTRSVIDIDTPGILNAGDPIKEFSDFVGKLAFCNPYAAGLFSYTKGTFSNAGGISTPAYPIIEDAVYTMVANTETTLLNKSRFIVVNGPVYFGDLGQYIGLNSQQLCKFNREILEYMSNVYAYNPDYDQLPVQKGDVNIVNQNLKVTSNIISDDSKLDCQLNDWVKLGSVKLCDYFEDLNTYLNVYFENEIIDQLHFIPDLTYCGVKDAPYLVSSLSYLLTTPDHAIQDLQIDLANNIVVKHSDASYNIISGQINKRALYTWFYKTYKDKPLTYKKLVQLDASLLGDSATTPVVLPEYITSVEASGHINDTFNCMVEHKYQLINMTYRSNLQEIIYSDQFDYYIDHIFELHYPTPQTDENTNLDTQSDSPKLYTDDKNYLIKENCKEDDDLYNIYAFPFHEYCGGKSFDIIFKEKTSVNNAGSCSLVTKNLEYDSYFEAVFIPFGMDNQDFRFTNTSCIPMLDVEFDEDLFEKLGLNEDEYTSHEGAITQALNKDDASTIVKYLMAELRSLQFVQLQNFFSNSNTPFSFRRKAIQPSTLDKITNRSSEQGDASLYSLVTTIQTKLNINSAYQYDFQNKPNLFSLVSGGLILLKVKTTNNVNCDYSYKYCLADVPVSVYGENKRIYGYLYTDILNPNFIYYKPGEKPTIANSTISINDLEYRPNSDGHRLFLRNDAFSPNGDTLSFRSTYESEPDKSKNTLRMYTGPGYHHMSEIYDGDPEQW